MNKTPNNSFRINSSESETKTAPIKEHKRPDYGSEKRQSFNRNLFKKVKQWWPLSKISGRIFLIYTLIVLLGGFLLTIPGVLTIYEDESKNIFHWDFLTGIFTASSAFSDTGINIVDPSHDYTFWGQLLILIMIEVGGLGVLTLKIVLFLAINKKISLNDTVTAQTERGSSVTSSTIEMIRDGFIWLTIVQFIAAIFLFFVFFFTEPGIVTNNSQNSVNGPNDATLNVVSPFHNFGKSLWFAIFHSTSAINNAGFDIISEASLQPYNVENHYAYLLQMIFLLEWVIGGLGYPTFHDIKRKIRARRSGQTVRFSLFTKLNFCVYITLFVVGPLSVLGAELGNYDKSLLFHNYSFDVDPTTGQPSNIAITNAKPVGVALMDIFFNTTSARNAGFSTINTNDFNAGSKTILSVMMFIGSAPSSTAGGIRTTTFAIIILANWAIIKNRSQTSAFKKTIPDKTVKRAFAVFFISVALIVLALIIIYCDSSNVLSPSNSPELNGNNSIIEIMTLITSAFGTVGLNPFTQYQMMHFGTLTKIVIIIGMFLGQLGISNTLLVFIKPSRKRPYQYLEEDVTIG